ncbi:retrovirus-related pol polyprotein from transposon TNT 1-94 [Tanacetum coccineum]
MEESLSKFMAESAKRHEENSNIIKEIRASTNVAIRNQGASIKTLELQFGQMSKVLQERGFRSLHSSTETNLRDQLKSISTATADLSEIRRMEYALVDLGASVSVMPFSTYTSLGLGVFSHTRLTIELADRTIKQPRGIAENVLVRIGKFVFPIDFIILDIPEDDDVPLILERPFLSTAHVKIDVFKRKVTLRDLAANEIDLMAYSEKCHVLNSHGYSEALINTPYAQTLKMENHPEQTIMGERISKKRTKNEAKNDKTGHGMEKQSQPKSKKWSAAKSQQSKSKPIMKNT